MIWGQEFSLAYAEAYVILICQFTTCSGVVAAWPSYDIFISFVYENKVLDELGDTGRVASDYKKALCIR
jgi:hypothetical protein